MKRILIAILLLLLLCACSVAKSDNIVHKVIESKSISFDSLEEMEDFSNLIIVCTRESEEEPILLYTDTGYIYGGFTFSHVKVKSIYKDNTNSVKENDDITILENEFYNKEQSISYHIGGYNKMVEGKEYLLFLEKASYHGREYYVASGIDFGTISLENDNRMTSYKYDNGTEYIYYDNYKHIWNAALEKYIINE